ncbi:MAG: glycosyltransferase family 2 protein [Candidatus Brocadiae bacterium]|nr:glycosyltransferase family 2 protein [Candidatus Brocadiia bacterium]
MIAPGYRVTVALPTRNEAGGIAKVVEQVRPYADEILVVDGHSTDATRDLAAAAGARVVLDGGRGKGDGIRTALEQATGEVVVFFDADGSHEPHDIPNLLAPLSLGKADLVVASRALGGSDEFRMNFEHFLRQMGSDFATWIVNVRWRASLTDIQNGFRAGLRSRLLDLHLNANHFDVEEEMIMKALKKGLRVVEVPSHEYERQWGRSKLATSAGWRFLVRLAREMV